MNENLKLAQTLAALAQMPKQEREVLEALNEIPPTEILQVAAVAELIYETFVRNEGPAWAELPAGAKGAFVLQVEAKIWPKAKPFETAVSQVTIDMMQKRSRFLAAMLKQSVELNDLERIRLRDEQDTAQHEMDEAVQTLERLIENYYARRNRARLEGPAT